MSDHEWLDPQPLPSTAKRKPVDPRRDAPHKAKRWIKGGFQSAVAKRYLLAYRGLSVVRGLGHVAELVGLRTAGGVLKTAGNAWRPLKTPPQKKEEPGFLVRLLRWFLALLQK